MIWDVACCIMKEGGTWNAIEWPKQCRKSLFIVLPEIAPRYSENNLALARVARAQSR